MIHLQDSLVTIEGNLIVVLTKPTINSENCFYKSMQPLDWHDSTLVKSYS